MVVSVRTLWSGEIPLARTFWTFGIGWGFFINFVATVAAMAAWTFAKGGDAGAIEVVALAIAVAPIPYNLFMMVAVWRSAGRYDGPPHWAALARVAIVVWTAVASVS